ncbi:MAG: hypothetical protein GDA48_19925 [Hormoscilla sp. GM102CHS1]|nr:hypothetical protein [Hormoscilla sp. GM102CHS1]
MPKQQKPNEFQKAVRKWIRILINGSKPPPPPPRPPKKGTESWYRDRLANDLGININRGHGR